jgi:thioredoxin-related protein
MPRRFLAAVALCLSVLSLSAADGWLTDLDEAKKVALAEKKAILVDFTGSDWCGWCIRLKKEVFDQQEFAAASKQFVLVELDFPQKKKLTPEAKAKNEALAKKFNVEGFPTIMLLDAQGEPFAQTGYQEGGPVKYLEHLSELSKANTPEGKKLFAQHNRDQARSRELGEELEKILDPFLSKKDLAGAEGAIVKFVKAKDVQGELRLTLLINARISSAQACKPGDHGAVIKAIDEILAETPAGTSGLDELKKFRAQVAAVQAADQPKK